MVTHDPKASQVGNRVVWIKDGRIQRDEPTNVIAAE
jgi:ABC-type lipoprotein export system ATPase subunit